MRLKKLICPLLALALVNSCFGVSVSVEKIIAADSDKVVHI